MKNNNKKGFTLIELLAVIVILAVIALIVTPIVTGIISNAKDSANARSVEGHIGDVNYAVLSLTMDGNSSAYDVAAPGGALPAAVSTQMTTQNSADKITCSAYTITNGVVVKATGCKDTGWSKTYTYNQGSNATAE